MTKTGRLAIAVTGALLAASSTLALAQDKFPTRTIRLVIPFAPGGGTDVMARRFALRASHVLGRSLVPDNKGGAGGVVGTAEVARAAPDGYTLLIGVSSTLAINPWAMQKQAYNAEKDFAAVTVMGAVPMSIVAHPSIGGSLPQLISRIRASPGRYSYGSAGVGSINHLTGELFKKEAGGLDIVHVPYKGSGPAVQELIGGQIPLVMATFSAMLAHHRAGKARILAVTAERRVRAAPDIPTAVEMQLPGMVALTWQSLMTPAGTPHSVIDTLHRAATIVMNDDAFQRDLEALGIEPVTDSSPARAAEFIASERARWGPIVKASGFRLD